MPEALAIDLGAARRHRLQDDLRVAGEQGLLVTDEERDTMEKCRHMPPRLGCALGATQIQSSPGGITMSSTRR
jgi:hypothetical protein